MVSVRPSVCHKTFCILTFLQNRLKRGGSREEEKGAVHFNISAKSAEERRFKGGGGERSSERATSTMALAAAMMVEG